MKILFTGDILDKEKQKAPLMVASNLFYSLISQGYDTAYLSYFKGSSSYYSKLFKQEVTSRKPFIAKTGIFPLLNYVIKNKPDIVYLTNIDFFYIVLFPLRYFLHFRMAYTVHGLIHYELKYFRKAGLFSSLKLKLIERMIFKYCDKIFFLSEKISRLSSIYFRIKTDRKKTIGNGIVPEKISKIYDKPIDTMRIKIVVVAALGEEERKEKGIDLLISYLNAPPGHKQFPVTQVPAPGESNPLPVTPLSAESKQLSSQVPAHKEDKTLLSSPIPPFLGNRKYEINIYGTEGERRESSGIVDINYYKFIKDDLLSSVLICNDIMIVPSRYDSFNMAMLKGMALGMICLCTDRVGLSERFNSDLSRFVYRYNNSEDFYEKLSYVINMDLHELKYYSAYMKNFAQEFSWEKVYEKYLSVFNELR